MKYRYANLMRPAGPGAVPRDGWIDTSFEELTTPSGHHAWGYVTYNRKLSAQEISDYELEELDNE